MFDFAWSEIALIGIVALVAIGPKDLPVAIKAVSQMVKKARKMAGEFQTHVDEMMRDADLGEMRKGLDDLRRLDIKGQILRAVDGDGTIRKTISEPVVPFAPPPPVPVHDLVPEIPVALPDPVAEAAPEASIAEPSRLEAALAVAAPAVITAAPAFVPPRYAPTAEPPPRVPPAFVPPRFLAPADPA